MRSIVHRGCVALVVAVLAGLAVPALAQQRVVKWPAVETQLARSRVQPGSALERLILDNQDFGLLDVRESDDKLPVPAWLRVIWRKAHPELTYDANDPTGGYPHVLKEVHEWMMFHQDLQPGPADPDLAPVLERTTVGTNVRASGAQTTPRSESDIRINFNNPSRVIAGSNSITSGGRQAMFYSSDGGSTWGQTSLSLTTGDSFHSDPAVDWTSDGTAWSATLGINSTGTTLKLRTYRSTDNGVTWTFDATPSGTQTNVDKELMWVDHSATSAFRNNIYITYHNGNPAYAVRRSAGAWGSPIQVSGAESTGTAIGGDVKTNANGDVFVFWTATGNAKIVMAKSTNGGTSYGTPKVIATTFDSYDIGIPGMNSRRALIYASGAAYRTATKDMVYAAWTDLSGETGCTAPANEPAASTTSTCKTRIWFARSTDGGTTWSAPVKVNNQAGLNDQFNQWIAVDETSGQVSLMYYDTVSDPGRKKTDVWYQTSTNDGASWGAAVKVTTAMTDETSAGSDSGNQYGDYNALSGYGGKFLPSWTDRRGNASEEIWTAPVTEVACTPPAAPAGLTATAVGTGRIDLAWGAVSGSTEYHVLRGTVSGGPYAQIAVTTTTSYSDTGLTGGQTYYYVVRAFAGCESANSNQASATAGGGGGGCTTQTLYTNGFEGQTGLGDWTNGTFVSGGSTADWRGGQACTAETGSNVFRFGGTSCTANYANNDYNFSRPKGGTGIAVPAGATSAQLKFGHRRRFESGYDGGTVAVSLDNANFTFVPATAILAGPTFNGQIANSCPPAGASGRAVWTGVQTTFVDSTINLDAVCNTITGGTAGCGGRTLYIAFTTISDCSVNDDGWFLDNVSVTACVP